MVLTAKDLVKTEDILLAGPEDSLTSALGKMSSSHDAVFVAQKKQLLGIISPYHVLNRGHKPAGTKVKNCLFLAPKLKPETKIDQIARLMLEAKVYFLPVVTNINKWLGIVSYRQLLRQLKGLKINPKAVTTCRENISFDQARNLIKKSGHARLIVVSPSGRLAGILTRSDLSRVINPLPGTPAKPYIKRSVFTFRPQDNPDAVVAQILNKKIGSAVMVNNNFQPVGILSIRDCLETIARPKTNQLLPQLQVRLLQVRSGWEAFARRGQIAAHAVGKFKKQTLRDALSKLQSRIRKN